MATFENSPSWCSSAGSSKIAIIIIPVEANQSNLFDDKEEEDFETEYDDGEHEEVTLHSLTVVWSSTLNRKLLAFQSCSKDKQ